MEAPIYTTEGKEKGTISLPESIFGAKLNRDLVHQVLVSIAGNARTPVAHTKDRGDVAGGGKKPWRQKGTGQARHGSIRSPLWRGGGVTFGPRNDRSYDRKINKKMKNAAMRAILSAKLRDGEVIFVEGFDFKAPKTKEASTSLSKLSKISGFEKLAYKTGKRALIVTADLENGTVKSFRNIASTHVEQARNIDPLTLATYKYVVVTSPKESVSLLEKRLATTAK